MSDIREIDGKYYDFAPKNETFITTARELRDLGIKNYYFMLRIDNPLIADIDPYKPNITEQEMQAIFIEIKGNMWYYARCVARVRTDLGVLPFGLHRGLAAGMWSFEHRYDWCLNEPRQTWKTTGTISGIITWCFQFSQNLKIHFFGKESDNTKRNLGHLKDDIDLLPEWMQFKKYLDKDKKVKKTRQSAEILENRNFHNELQIHPKPASRSHAIGMGRGASAAILLFDEIEHTPYFGEILSNSAPLFKTASDNAKIAGLPYGRIFTTTPGDLDTPEGIATLPIIKSMIPWTEKIYDMTPEEIEEYKSAYQKEYHNDEEKKEREVVDIFYMEYHYYQVRKNYAWVMEQYKLSGDKLAIRREILLQRLRGSTDSPIDQETLEYFLQNMQKSVNDLIINNKWRFRLYKHGQGMVMGRLKDLDENIPYIVGIDPAGGGGGDNFAISVVNPYNLEIAAEFKNPYISGPDAVRLLVTLVNDYIPKAVLIPEKNSMGIYLLQMLAETSIANNLYWSESARQLEEIVEEDVEDYELKKASVKWKKYAIYTSEKIRDQMFETLFEHVNDCKDLLLREYLVEDLCKLIKRWTGKKWRFEAVKKEHDDNLMSYLIVLYIYYFGDNLLAFGIDTSEHPILGKIEKDTDEILYEKDSMSGFFSTSGATYESLAIEEAIRIEEEIKYAVSSNLTYSTYTNDIYSKEKLESKNPWDDNVDIQPYFFDLINAD